jgi:ADP-heptose:LPS heptosyltransferase
VRQWLRILMLAFVRIVGLPGAIQAARRARKPVSDKPRILLVRPDHLGDMVLTTPVFQALNATLPNAQITLMVGPWSREVAARHPDIDRIIPCAFPGFRRAAQNPFMPYVMLFRVARQLRRQRYDLAINLRPDFWWGAALLYLTRIPRRVGYAIAPGAPFLNFALPFITPEAATVSSLRLTSAALETLGCAPLTEPYTPERYPTQFAVSVEEEAWVSARLQQEGIDAATPIVVIHPGTGAAVKLWRDEAWSHCANALPSLLTSSPPARIILTGSESERPMLERIAADITMPPLIISDMSVGQLAALLRRATLALGVDNGPMHLAVSQGTPTIHIFGPTDPGIYSPWGAPDRHVVIAATRRCPGCPAIPCGRLDFTPRELAEHPCTKLITEETVEQAIVSLVRTEKLCHIMNDS